jgi:Cu/Ag efflux protein CusF
MEKRMKARWILFAVVLLFVSAFAFGHGGHKHVIGTVSSVSSRVLVVTTSSGEVSVPLTNTTRFYHGSGTGQAATHGEVVEGIRVVVHLGADGKAVEVHIPEMTTSEKVGSLEAKIVGRDSVKNQLTVAHGEVKGVMGAMTMGYEVRGQKVTALPPDGTVITAKLHDSNGKQWLTDIRWR